MGIIYMGLFMGLFYLTFVVIPTHALRPEKDGGVSVKTFIIGTMCFHFSAVYLCYKGCAHEPEGLRIVVSALLASTTLVLQWFILATKAIFNQESDLFKRLNDAGLIAPGGCYETFNFKHDSHNPHNDGHFTLKLAPSPAALLEKQKNIKVKNKVKREWK